MDAGATSRRQSDEVSRCARRRRSISAAAQSRSSGSAAVAGGGKRRECRGADGGSGSSLRFISVSVSFEAGLTSV